MALVGNGVRLSASNPMRQYGAPLVGNVDPGSWLLNGSARNLWVGDAAVVGVTDRSAYPNGYLHPGAWHLPQKAGGLASYTQVAGEGDLTANLAGGLAAAATLNGVGAITGDLMGLGLLLATLPGASTVTGDLTGTGQMVTALAGLGGLSGDLLALLNAVATLAGTGAISGDLDAAAVLAATLAGVGSITGNLAGGAALVALLGGTGALSGDLSAAWLMEATLGGSGAVATAVLTALGNAVATLNGVGTIAGTPTALGFMEAVITACEATGDCPTAGEVADAVWEAVVANYNTTGTFGFAVGFMYYSTHNKVITDPVAGTYDVYADDDVTVIFTGSLWEDAGGTQLYQGDGADRRDRLTP